jgi:F0F1-type ATP synthase assembly protein I
MFKSSMAYSKENDGSAIESNIQQGTTVHTVSSKVLCCIFGGIISEAFFHSKPWFFLISFFKIARCRLQTISYNQFSLV